MQLLDAAPLVGQNSAEIKPNAKDAADKLANYTTDQTNYYNIRVVERAAKPEILTFAEADQNGILVDLLNKQLEASYAKIREQDPKAFQR